MAAARAALIAVTAVCAAAALVPGAASAKKASPFSTLPGTVKVTRDGAGIPHIVAANFDALGLGEGYAFAQDNLCTFANDIVTLEGERSKYFGPNALAVNYSAGTSATNLQSDLYWRYVAASGLVKRELTAKGINGLLPQVRQLYTGFVAGYNRYLRSGQNRDPAVQGQAVGAADHAHRHVAARRADRHRGLGAAVPGRHRQHHASDWWPGPGRPGRPCHARLRGAEGAVRRSGRPLAGLKRNRPRFARHALAPRHGAGQPTLPVGRDRALLDGATRRAGQVRRRGRDARGLPDDRHRLQPPPRVDAHGVDRRGGSRPTSSSWSPAIRSATTSTASP